VILTNYRPISLLSVFNRIFKRVIYSRLICFINKHKILSPAQYGFRKNHSTQHAIIDIVDKICKNMESKKFTCGIFIDLKKAFDTVDHSILLSRLNNYGICCLIRDWLNSYLSDRSQTTSIGNCTSEVISCSYGVPQGSVLGPLLFVLYIKDISSSSDNTSMLYSHCDIHALEHIVNDELRKVCLWLEANKLTLNISKSNCYFPSISEKKL
jgi:retron-type reverse transcriptase